METTNEHHCCVFSADDPNPLPPGFCQTYTEDGRLLFWNHVTGTYTLEDPRSMGTPDQIRKMHALSRAMDVFIALPDLMERYQGSWLEFQLSQSTQEIEGALCLQCQQLDWEPIQCQSSPDTQGNEGTTNSQSLQMKEQGCEHQSSNCTHGEKETSFFPQTENELSLHKQEITHQQPKQMILPIQTGVDAPSVLNQLLPCRAELHVKESNDSGLDLYNSSHTMSSSSENFSGDRSPQPCLKMISPQ